MAMDPNSLVGQSQRELGKTISGQYLTTEGNPAMQAAIDAARRTVSSQFSGDNYGGSANQEWLARGAASAASPLLAQERQNQLNALQLAPGLQMANTSQLAGAGAAQEARGQAEIGASQQQFNAPWDLLQRYQQGIAGGLAAGGNTQTEQPYFQNNMASGLGLGLGGLAFANPFMMGAGLLTAFR
jgi:hypothetical protein